MSSEIVIKVENLTKCYQIYVQPRDRLKQFFLPALQKLARQTPKNYYREFWAMKDVSFEIKKGETVGIIGKNGAGKSTLLQLLTGTLAQTSGTVQVNGRIAALLELGSGFNPEFTGRENVYLNGAIIGMAPEEINARMDAILAFADIGDFIDQPVKTYSSGMYVRLAFAIQANVDPDILIVDEALAVGDAYFVHKCMQHFRYMQNRGTTILLVSHDATAIKTLCKRAVWLDKSGVAAIGLSGVVVDQYLAAISNLPVLIDFGVSTADTIVGGANLGGFEVGECSIPNMDRRVGDQSCTFVGIGLYDKHMCRTAILSNNSTMILRVTFRNNAVQEGRRLVLGYALRNSRCIDIASNNSEIDNFEIRAPLSGATRTVRMHIELPELHPGSYSLNVSLGYRKPDGSMNSTDGITNAVVFDVVSRRLVHVLMSFKTKYEIE